MYTISNDRAKLDVDLIHSFLSRESYWARNIPRDIVERSIENSFCFGAYDADGRQVGFARVITDFAVYAYLADVFVIAEKRGGGIGALLLAAIREHPRLQGLRRWSLITADAHSLYRKFGFVDLFSPERYMEIVVRNPYAPKS